MRQRPSTDATHGSAADQGSTGVLSGKITKNKKIRGQNSRDISNVFGTLAPPANLRLPSGLDVTALELLVFLPNAIRSHAAMNRLAQAHGNTHDMRFMLEQHRYFEKSLSNNSLYACIRNSMIRGKAYNDPQGEQSKEGWTWARQYDSKMDAIFKDPCYEPTELTLNGLQVREQDDGLDYPLKNLINGVKKLPQGEDALMLTKCVRFAASNAELDIQLHRDLPALINYLGGAPPISDQHLDAAAFSRWAKEHKKNISSAQSDSSPNTAPLVGSQYTRAMLDAQNHAAPIALPVDSNGIVIKPPFQRQSGTFNALQARTRTRHSLVATSIDHHAGLLVNLHSNVAAATQQSNQDPGTLSDMQLTDKDEALITKTATNRACVTTCIPAWLIDPRLLGTPDQANKSTSQKSTRDSVVCSRQSSSRANSTIPSFDMSSDSVVIESCRTTKFTYPDPEQLISMMRNAPYFHVATDTEQSHE